jgi:hypothetical protein
MQANRSTCVRGTTYLFLGALALIAAGCGGTISGGQNGSGEVGGVVFDKNGDIVRGARVFLNSPSREATSNSSGTYVLSDVPAEDLLIRAEVTQNGVHYVGQNLARVFDQDRSKNVNIVVVPDTQLAALHGTVFDSFGGVVSGARVFAIGDNNLSSSMDITDSNGDYSIGRLAAGVHYTLYANAPGYQSDSFGITLSTGDNPREDFTVNQVSGVANLPAPTNLDAIAWTSPDDSTRSIDSASAYEAIKREFDPNRASRTAITRLTPSGEIIEVDLTWTPVISSVLLGYGLYRAQGSGGTLVADDFLRDPLAEFYADTDLSLEENTTYSYALTSVNSDQQESGFSTRAVVTTLGPIDGLSPLFGPLRFRWDDFSGADNFVVYLFDQNPKVGISSIWNNEGSPTTSTTLTYTGPGLISGHTYYYLVLGLANSNTSRTISRVVSFTA